ncbi:MAG TPA: cytochrome c oxidase subunit II, partial [Ilumatobacteraceae bacterium]|nr:cytochrome c oxidase subunit II [Ilumatobacteraceae bacterium]
RALGWWLLIVSAVVVVVITVLIVVGALHRPGERSGTELARTAGRSGLAWIYFGGLIIPAAILIVSFAWTLGTLHATVRPPTDPAADIQIIGRRWWWEVRYVDPRDPTKTIVTANEIHIPVGKPVRLEITSDDVIHSFWIPQLAGKTDAIPGVTNVSWFEADTSGIYRGQCTEYCGLQHANMAAVVIAEDPVTFAAWEQAQQQPATAPSDPEAAAGLAVFQKSACATCHAIRGSDALGRVGPDLTHLASRMTIAAGTLENTRGNLAGWIGNSQSIKPGNDMPVMKLPPNDLQALLSYLETLK